MTKYKVLKADTNHGIYEFLIDKASDLKVLPKKTGSTAFVIDTGEKYICSNTKEWKVLNNINTDSGSSGDSGGENESATYTLSMMLANANDTYNHVIVGMVNGEEMQLSEGTIQPFSDNPLIQVMQCEVPAGAFISVGSTDNIGISPTDSYIQALGVPSSVITPMNFPVTDSLPALPYSYGENGFYFTMPSYDTFVEMAALDGGEVSPDN